LEINQIKAHLANQIPIVSSEMKFFMWYNSYAIYGGRETLILLKPVLNTSSVSLFNYLFVYYHTSYLD